MVSALKSATLPYHVLGNQAQGTRVTQPDPNTVVTAVLAADQNEMIRFVTTIAPDGSGSRVSTAVEPPRGRYSAHAGKAMAENAYAMALMGKLAHEHVAAAIEGRPFDMLFATAPMARGMLAANPEAQAHIDAANQSAAAMNAAADHGDAGHDRDETATSEEEERDWARKGGWGR
ncbi:MAG: hypothetical protein IT550_15665 [Novosphingobium sp.]|nr:hypothetical protein [Novosphingobium sp.]